ncbi:MAG: 4Fe-4S binding protein [Candidatus Gastranaerophilales bacterium]|nr:4Fe-4S binding protein [Candidatus Gastranaerophilales bacterium]
MLDNMSNIFSQKNIKIILGANNQNPKRIKKTVKVYALAGVRVFDTGADKKIIKKTKKILEKIYPDKDFHICASITLSDDVHSKTAHINKDKCVQCKKCVKKCPHKAITHNIKVDEKSCIGCGVCVKVCPKNAIKLKDNAKTFEEQFKEIPTKSVNYIEIHTNGKNADLAECFEFLKDNFDGEIGICISSSQTPAEKIEIIEKVKQIIAPQKLIVQADGSSMSGFDNREETTQKAIEECKNFQNISDIILIASGGTNSKTMKLAGQQGLKLDGIALGTYARLLIKDYVLAGKSKPKLLPAVEIAKNLVKELEK